MLYLRFYFSSFLIIYNLQLQVVLYDLYPNNFYYYGISPINVVTKQYIITSSPLILIETPLSSSVKYERLTKTFRKLALKGPSVTRRTFRRQQRRCLGRNQQNKYTPIRDRYIVRKSPNTLENIYNRREYTFFPTKSTKYYLPYVCILSLAKYGDIRRVLRNLPNCSVQTYCTTKLYYVKGDQYNIVLLRVNSQSRSTRFIYETTYQGLILIFSSLKIISSLIQSKNYQIVIRTQIRVYFKT